MPDSKAMARNGDRAQPYLCLLCHSSSSKSSHRKELRKAANKRSALHKLSTRSRLHCDS